ncbi:MAG: EamA family transporter [Proteobacteria bacterium]|nr:EamA family transporter [Pseudomonadota bacterium]
MIGILFIFGACLLWAIDTLFRYPLLGSGVLPEKIVFFEHLFLFLAFLPFLFARREKLKTVTPVHWFCFFMIGAIGSALGTITFTKAFGYLNPTLVILLQKFQPLVAITLSGLILKERIGKKFILWAIVSIGGGLLLISQDITIYFSQVDWQESALEGNVFMGYLLTLIAVFSWGSATVFGKILVKAGYQERQIMGGRFFFGLIALSPIFFYLPILSADSSADVYGKIALMALISGLLGMYLYYRGLKLIHSKVCSLAETAFPVMALIVNWLFLDVSLTPVQLLGACILITAATVIQLRRY